MNYMILVLSLYVMLCQINQISTISVNPSSLSLKTDNKNVVGSIVNGDSNAISPTTRTRRQEYVFKSFTTTTTTTTTKEAPIKMCRRHVYGNGAGSTPNSCPDGKEKKDSLCYTKCRDGHFPGVTICYDVCRFGYTNTGTSCYKGVHVYGKGCCCTVFGCCHNCADGYIDDGCTCRFPGHSYKADNYDRGEGTPMICSSDLVQNGGLCFPKCADGYENNGVLCTMKYCTMAFPEKCAIDMCAINVDVCHFSFIHNMDLNPRKSLVQTCSYDRDGWIKTTKRPLKELVININ